MKSEIMNPDIFLESDNILRGSQNIPEELQNAMKIGSCGTKNGQYEGKFLLSFTELLWVSTFQKHLLHFRVSTFQKHLLHLRVSTFQKHLLHLLELCESVNFTD